MATYDSKKVRELANGLRKLTNGIDGDVKPGIRYAIDGLDPLRGRTASAMQEKLEQYRRDAERLAQDFGKLTQLASTYADRLEQLDKELAQEL